MTRHTPVPVLLLSPEQHRRFGDRLGTLLGETPLLDGSGMSDDDLEAALSVLARELRQSTVDSLTGLADRRQGLARLEELAELFATTLSDPIAVVLIDLDHFKQINDLYGHAEGDQVLQGVGQLLKIPRDGMVLSSRFGGEEFLVLFQGSRSMALRALDDLKDSFSTLRTPNGEGVTASFGVAFAKVGDRAQDLLARADQNLYQAKCEGRNRIVAEVEGSARLSDFEIELRDYENRVRVFADRLVTNLTSRGRKMALSLRDEADHDGLTGLHNRRYFDRRLEREIERSRQLGSPLSLLLLDLDDFGAVNRDYGYPAGDDALREAAQALHSNMRLTDWAARYGGEELCGIFPDTDTDSAVAIAERIKATIARLEPKGTDGRAFSITASLGVVTLSGRDTTTDLFIQRAGLAVRGSKNAGKNRVTVA